MGCGEFSADQKFTTLQSLQDVDNSLPLEHVTVSKPYCEVDYADYEMSANLLAFEIFDKKNIGFGFNLGGILQFLGLSLKTERGRMLMAMDLKQTLRPSEFVADVTGEGISKGSEFRINLDIAKWGVDFGYFYQTPLSKLTEKTLHGTLKNIATELAQVETEWKTKVVLLPTAKEVIIPTGSVAGVRLGDTFKIYNVESLWKGDACKSELLMHKELTPGHPQAYGKVTQLEKNAALLELYNVSDDTKLELGAKVVIDNLPLAKKEKSRSLRRSVRVMSVTSEKLPIATGANIDLTVYLNEQLTALFDQYGFYQRK